MRGGGAKKTGSLYKLKLFASITFQVSGCNSFEKNPFFNFSYVKTYVSKIHLAIK